MSILNMIMTALGYIVAFAAIVLLISYSIRQYEKIEELEKNVKGNTVDIDFANKRMDSLNERIAMLETRSQGDDGK